MKLDSVDVLILNELNKDGRASFREIGRRASLSTPTVSSRFNRMMKAGLIRKFVPLMDTDTEGVLALVTLRTSVSRATEVASALSRLRPVYEAMITTGRENIVLKLRLENAFALQSFLASRAVKKLGAEVAWTQIITKTIKEERPLPFAKDSVLELRCDYCGGEIASTRPYSIKVSSSRYYFCCKTCRRSYLDKHAATIRRLNESKAA